MTHTVHEIDLNYRCSLNSEIQLCEGCVFDKAGCTAHSGVACVNTPPHGVTTYYIYVEVEERISFYGQPPGSINMYGQPAEARALNDSVLHWQDNVNRAKAGLPLRIGAFYCALCDYHASCKTCPVALHTGEMMCQGTPYEAACFTETQEDTINAAQEELDFLRMLQDKG